MTKFVKKPIPVEAVQFTDPEAPPDGVVTERHPVNQSSVRFYVMTAHGAVYLKVGDWVLKESDGSGYYPCRADIFEATYVPAPEGS
jgi:hypothetical protein